MQSGKATRKTTTLAVASRATLDFPSEEMFK
jgi:hypothetical protein